MYSFMLTEGGTKMLWSINLATGNKYTFIEKFDMLSQVFPSYLGDYYSSDSTGCHRRRHGNIHNIGGKSWSSTSWWVSDVNFQTLFKTSKADKHFNWIVCVCVYAYFRLIWQFRKLSSWFSPVLGWLIEARAFLVASADTTDTPCHNFLFSFRRLCCIINEV